MDIHKLSAKKIEKLPDGQHMDGNGLCLVVKDNGTSRCWRYIRHKANSYFNYGLGSFDHLSLEAARKLVNQINDALAEGIHPKAYLQSLLPPKDEKKPSLNDIFEKALQDIAKVKRWRTTKTKDIWRSVTQMYALPLIGDIPVDKITHEEVVRVLKPIWETKHHTATRVKNCLRAFLDWAALHGYRTGENPANGNEKLALVFSKPYARRQPKPNKAIGVEEIPALCEKLWRSKKIGHKAVLFGILTATQVNDFREAKWKEFDFKNRIWTIPSTRRKDRKPLPHRVPLSNETIALLEQLSHKTGSLKQGHPKRGCLFPGNKDTFINCNTPYTALQCTGYKVTMIGMRSTFQDWAAITRQDLYACEVALSRSFGNRTTRSYLRTDMLDERREIMQKWADHCFKNINRIKE